MTVIQSPQFPDRGRQPHGDGSDSASPALSDTRPIKNVQVRDELLADGSMVLYHSGTRELMTLNPTAALVWESCDGVHDEAAIAAEVREAFSDVATIEHDVTALLHDLSTRGMVEVEIKVGIGDDRVY